MNTNVVKEGVFNFRWTQVYPVQNDRKYFNLNAPYLSRIVARELAD